MLQGNPFGSVIVWFYSERLKRGVWKSAPQCTGASKHHCETKLLGALLACIISIL